MHFQINVVFFLKKKPTVCLYSTKTMFGEKPDQEFTIKIN